MLEEFAQVNSRRLAELTREISRKQIVRDELFYNIAFSQYFPGIYSLIESGQHQAACKIMRAQNIYTVVWPNGDKELRIQERVVARLDALKFLKEIV